jgi:hypothetical protein
MNIGSIRRDFYGMAVSSDALKVLPIPSMASHGIAAGSVTATATVAAFGDLQARDTRPYILEKHYIAGRIWTGTWYFGRCRNSQGTVVPGTERLQPYPFRIYYDNGTGVYGTLPIGCQGIQGRVVALAAGVDFRTYVAATPTAAVGVGDDAQGAGLKIYNGETSSATGLSATAASMKIALTSGVIATSGCQSAAETSTGATRAAAGIGAVTDSILLSNLVNYSTITTFSGGKTNVAALHPTSLITDSTGQTASTTLPTVSATTTTDMAHVGVALAEFAAIENRRFGLLGMTLGGTAIGGTTAVQGLFLNIASVTTANGDDGTDTYICGEILLNGLITVTGIILGDI